LFLLIVASSTEPDFEDNDIEDDFDDDIDLD